MKNFLSILFVILFIMEGKAQFDRRATIYGFVGVPFMGKDNIIQTKSVFEGYAPIPYFGAVVQYALNQHIHVGGSFRQLLTKKPNYVLSNTGLGLSFKYNIIPADKTISPFISIEPNINFTHITKNLYKKNVFVGHKTIEEVDIKPEGLSEPKVVINIFPVMGANFSIGTDFTLKKKYGLFISLNYFTSNASGLKIVKSNYEHNNSTFKYVSIQTGIKFSFLRSKNVY